MAWSRPGAEVHTSNQASASSSVPQAVAASAARRSARNSSSAVASAAIASPASRPVQASTQCLASAVAGSVLASTTHQGSRNPATPSPASAARRASAEPGRRSLTAVGGSVLIGVS
jgi:hypothetical protein